MADDIHERLAVVETTLKGLSTQVTQQGDDLRIVRDYVISRQGASKGHAKAFGIAVAIIGAITGVYQAFGDRIAKFFG